LRSFDQLIVYLVYALPLVAVYTIYLRRRRTVHAKAAATLAAAHEAGLTEPSSLHPIIDPSLCLGCKTCITACPEGEILGLLDGKAVLVDPASCIGHGACKEACPQDAITLVLGTEARGVEIPVVDSSFRSSVPGIYVAGELGGMGLIRNAIEQGRQAMESIHRDLKRRSTNGALDVVVVGAGPAGFSASLTAKELGLRCATLEQNTLGGTVAHYPRGKLVMTNPVQLPLYGSVRLRETTKEGLLEFWRDVERRTGVEIEYGVRVERILARDGSFEVMSPGGSYAARAVMLAIGRRGTPRKLGVPGEELSKVVYSLVDPEQYRSARVLVVGGGDSALEAATSLAQEPGCDVVISYRRDAFSRAKPKNRERLRQAEAAGRLRVELESEVVEIGAHRVVLDTRHGRREIENDAVIVCAGGILPTGFLKECSVEVTTVHGAPVG
jgi:thioredoxin reductase (NADPH)